MFRTGKDLFETIKLTSTFTDILNIITGNHESEIQSKKGNVYEKMWDILIKFGCVPEYLNDSYDHYTGNVNIPRLDQSCDNLEHYLQTMCLFSKGAGGSSDITLQHKQTKEWIFVSSKFYYDDSKKSIKDYDIQDIISIAELNRYKYHKYSIVLFVHDKIKVENIINNVQETNYYLRDAIKDIYDLTDLEFYYTQFRKEIHNLHFNDINERFCNNRICLQPRFHQELLTIKILNKINENEKDILLAAKARSGKTYCIGNIFLKYVEQYKHLNALIITPAPKETMSQFTKDLFHKFRNFINFNIIEIKNGKDLKRVRYNITNNIIIVSKQLLDRYVNYDSDDIIDKSITRICNLELDIIVFDENHFGGTTERSENIINACASKHTTCLYLTATYAKPLNKWYIKNSCQFYWDIEDEQLCKKRNIDRLIEKHGQEVSLLLNESNKERLLSIYDKMPDLHLITNIFDQERYNEIKIKIKDTSYGFSNSTLLSTTKDGKNFNYTCEVDNFLKYLSGQGLVRTVIRDEKSPFERIKKLSAIKNTRTNLTNGNFTSQLWFLPFGVGLKINHVSICLKDRMLKNKIFQNYEIMIVNSTDNNCKDVKRKIHEKECEAKVALKDGLIILAGNQLSLGVTLPLVDIVVLLNDISSSDKIFQMMYRSMTESTSGDKKIGYVIDLNISRVLNTLLDYTIHKKDLTITQTLNYIIKHQLINIDADLFSDYNNNTKLCEKLLEIWKTNPLYHFKPLARELSTVNFDISEKDQLLLRKYFFSISDDKINQRIKVDENNNQHIQNGKSIIKIEETEKIHEQKDISLTKDVLPFIIPLTCMLTMNDHDYSLSSMLNTIDNDDNLLGIFESQCYIWWSHEDMINKLIKIVDKYVKETIYDIIKYFKMSLVSLIDQPKELLEFIDGCLKPKQKEKQENGEVFTPLSMINEMLDELDKYYISEHDKSIFTEKHLKWGDVLGSGMGNFSVAVYLRLMDGLSVEIKNKEERKKHILENMIYMAEQNKKNVYICRQLFDMHNVYNLNIYEGDALKLDTNKEWKVDKFDVILGNPPYNKGGIKSCSNDKCGEKNETVWPLFIKHTFTILKPNGYFACINPSSWLRKGHAIHDILLTKHIYSLKLWDNSQSKSVINADIPLSIYVLHNIINEKQYETEITSVLKRKNIKTTSIQILNKDDTIPLAYHSIFNKLRTFIDTNELHLEYSKIKVKAMGVKSKLPTTYKLDDLWVVDTYTIKEGIMVKKAIVQHPHANKRKLIIANKSSFVGAFIDDGKLGIAGNHNTYIMGDNLELILQLLKFKLCNIICQCTKYQQDFLEKDAYDYLPDLRKLNILNITEAEFYDLLKLDNDELRQINEF